MLSRIFALYNQFLAVFPEGIHFWLSLAILLVLIKWLLSLLKRSLVWLLLLVIFVPASVPILKEIAFGVVEFLEKLISLLS